MIFDKLTDIEKYAYLMKPILTVLQDAGGQLERSEIKSRICDLDDNIAEYEQTISVSQKTGKEYKKFDFKFNFAIKNLSIVGLLTYERYNPIITLTNEGARIDVDKFDGYNDVLLITNEYWKDNAKKNTDATILDKEDEDDSSNEDPLDDIKVQLQTAIKNMSPKKFEQFSRALLTKMGVEFTEKGISISNDGGIDGYGYHRDKRDFRTTRVVIQCKRYNVNPVGEPEINQFLGAMNKFQADYGVFITNSRFTQSAKEAAKEGTPITLIDGNDLIDLIIEFELYIKPVTTYILDGFYYEE